ncbi:ribosome biogenesis protein Tsr1 [Schizosaccharomyces japonicus yFS275]|uniref:Ribosome biogenesis protein Tsr1 n=1 Tax=Schizosaccharomyces japonicus (strain yFS275 / FY16936) TaxID=402676 RepID=B6JVD7_SCHJY|nr:ribosome biogenesis protein Tsr1 [Schizosaccharomyces japonicus yFS275]EEB05338.1 ribosome biogenesis protein Tsr1 [Schizosaccharomyces japonicus yFS275]
MSDAQHHHRSSQKKKKSFKSKHASKSALKEAFRNRVEPKQNGIKPALHTSSKADRKNKAKQIQMNKRAEIANANRIFGGRNGAPKIVSVISLCANVDAWSTLKKILSSLETEIPEKPVEKFSVTVDRFRQKLQFLVPRRDFLSMADAAKASDYTIFILSATQEVDEFGELVIRTVQGQGASTVISVVDDLTLIDGQKLRTDVKKSLISFMNFFFSDQERIWASDISTEAQNIVRILCTTHPKGVHWRDTRAYVVADDLSWNDGKLAVSGIVRGKGLDPDRLVHIQGFGDFQVDEIHIHPQVRNGVKKQGDVDMEGSEPSDTIVRPTENQDSLDELAPAADVDDMDMAEDDAEKPKGVRLDDFYYFEDEEVPAAAQKRVPKGTSTYQAAWIPDDEEEVYSDAEETEVITVGTEEPKRETVEEEANEVVSDTDDMMDDTKSEMYVELSAEEEARQLAEYRRQVREEEEEREFPDEIELMPDELARERLRKYRGLRSMFSSPWDPEEPDANEPADWRRLFRFQNYRNMKNKMLKQPFIGDVKPGQLVTVYVRNVPESVYQYYADRLFVLYSLMEHEHKLCVSHFTVTKHSEYENPIKSKEELVLQVGPRRMFVNPLYSDASTTGTSNKVQKFNKFLQPSQLSVATAVLPINFGSSPVLLFKQDGDSLKLAATGTFVNTDHNVIIAKRAVLTGHPFKIHKKLVTVRYMFFNPEDVLWYKPIQLFTKQGRTGFIKEPLGTHGYFKATFNGKLTVQDTVAMSLYKRVYPRMSRPLLYTSA